ncbi:hypothetical protein DP113_13935 [Brasilonema octagenarum UFV-E1]|uniref:Uncharacterized protein n=2 Tax=Brasilonema TaxID=383614 RepID=A0A856MI91_9CYAN|nr:MULTISPECIES: hypothetical protein [Brasilonema]NMF64645.1 hypothetical protein [Brasilonema octagenarum UFV-OR1]QDL08857.1 hypothetical protein DP114_13995 [Brasilonema sennae CENA114]QDL15214.1 hypothetical protein DP113_13935 [Brasilonema octagenarum UFV-E1]
MKTAEKLAAGWLLTLGFMFLSLSASAVMQKNAMDRRIEPSLRQVIALNDFRNQDAVNVLDNTALNGLIFGVPTSVLGVWLALGVYRKSRDERKAIKEQTTDQLQSTFYRMIQENNGRITLVSFAMQLQLPPATAKQYLDDQAKVFNANFKVNEEGGVSYHFDV